MKIAIVDDDVNDRELLIQLIKASLEHEAYALDITQFDSGESLLEAFEPEQFDICFLDIYMKKLNGMETARKLREISCNVPIVFLTASPDYAIESYEVQASGYLLKPFSEEKLKTLINRILKTDMKRRVAIKSKRQYRYPYTDEIMYIESDRHNVTLHLSDGSEIVTVDKLVELEKRINENRFLHCHQSYLVNMDFITDVKDDFILSNGEIIPIRVRGRKEMADTYYSYFKNHFDDEEE